jgi:hypothetical protein
MDSLKFIPTSNGGSFHLFMVKENPNTQLKVPTSLAFFYYGLNETNDLMSMLKYYIFGVFLWSFLEYFLHRFLFHAHTSSRLGNTLHFIFHGVHHLDPLDPNRLVFPPFVMILTFYLPAHLLFRFIFGPWGLNISSDKNRKSSICRCSSRVHGV